MQDGGGESRGSVPLSNDAALLSRSVFSPCILKPVYGVIIFNRGICIKMNLDV